MPPKEKPALAYTQAYVFSGNAWGDGILQNGKELRLLIALDDEAGMRELRSKVNHVKEKPELGEETKLYHPPNRFSIHSDYCFGEESQYVSQQHLNSGVLERLVEKYSAPDAPAICFNGEFNEGGVYNVASGDTKTALVVLAMGALSLKCNLPAGLIERVKALSEELSFGPEAKAQIKQALQDFKKGVTYRVDSPPVWMARTVWREYSKLRMAGIGGPESSATMQSSMEGSYRKISLVCAGNVSTIIVAPPPDEDFMQPSIMPYDRCGECGREVKDDGSKLDVCGGCKHRRYCSKECQKLHRKLHKPICSLSEKQIEDILALVEPGATDLSGETNFDKPVVMTDKWHAVQSEVGNEKKQHDAAMGKESKKAEKNSKGVTEHVQIGPFHTLSLGKTCHFWSDLDK